MSAGKSSGPRQRIAVACDRCRRRKIKCTGNETPDHQCAACSKAHAECHFAAAPMRNSRRKSAPLHSASVGPTFLAHTMPRTAVPMGVAAHCAVPGAVETLKNDPSYPPLRSYSMPFLQQPGQTLSSTAAVGSMSGSCRIPTTFSLDPFEFEPGSALPATAPSAAATAAPSATVVSPSNSATLPPDYMCSQTGFGFAFGGDATAAWPAPTTSPFASPTSLFSPATAVDATSAVSGTASNAPGATILPTAAEWEAVVASTRPAGSNTVSTSTDLNEMSLYAPTSDALVLDAKSSSPKPPMTSTKASSSSAASTVPNSTVSPSPFPSAGQGFDYASFLTESPQLQALSLDTRHQHLQHPVKNELASDTASSTAVDEPSSTITGDISVPAQSPFPIEYIDSLSADFNSASENLLWWPPVTTSPIPTSSSEMKSNVCHPSEVSSLDDVLWVAGSLEDDHSLQTAY
ncbi:transcription factor [Schizosaccharomyces japonicus yFS275]|uniref:Transcription factor n=1 Tax=Schizosaccharomyces japonicus (strain yFS275 / FY16936) TaxID=402676 RepID=B6K0L3_SCHJY|nr:transcription factor [Schizosaccharomyces japonicus yFS275]EEB07484.2 transcription factor [Schizosaccharomyces japonicus yFS275]